MPRLRPWQSRPVLWETERIASGRALLYARSAVPGLYLVVGEAGAGKSAFLDYLVRGLAFYQQMHRHCPAPCRAQGPPDADWVAAEPYRRRWVVLAEGGDPADWAEISRRHPVFLSLPPDRSEVEDPPNLRLHVHLPPLSRRETRAFLYRAARAIRRRVRALPPRQRPAWTRAYLGPDEALREWAEASARRLSQPPLAGLSLPLFLWNWAEAYPPGRPPPTRLGKVVAGMVDALVEHAGGGIDPEAARALAALLGRGWASEERLREAGLLAAARELERAGLARRFCPDCWGFSHPLFAAYFRGADRPPEEPSDFDAWLLYLEALPEARRRRVLLELEGRLALRLAGRLGLVLDELFERVCRDLGARPDDRVALAADPWTPYEVLERLAQDRLLRWVVAANPGAPRELLLWIAEQAAGEPEPVREGILEVLGKNPGFAG